jgi:hypothetical protein
MSNIIERFFGGKSDSDDSTNKIPIEIHNIIGELSDQRDAVEEINKAREDDDEEEELDVPYTEAAIHRPTDEVVLESAIKRLQDTGAKEIKRSDVGVVESPSESLDNPTILLDDFDTVLRGFHDELKHELKEQTVHSEFRHLGDSSAGKDREETFAYIIAETDKGILVGGASNIIDNIAAHQDLNDIQREYIRLVYDECLRESEGLEDILAHTILDDVLFIFDENSFSNINNQRQEE